VNSESLVYSHRCIVYEVSINSTSYDGECLSFSICIASRILNSE